MAIPESSLPVIDAESCIACAACIDICPDGVLQRGAGGVAEMVGRRCMLCGHCQAVCPVAAIVVPGLLQTLELRCFPEYVPRSGPARIDPAGLLLLMRQRRSCRRFTEDPVDPSLLVDLAKIGTTAPSGTNSQCWRFIILPARADVERLGAATAQFYQRLNRLAANPLLRLVSLCVGGGALSSYYQRYYPTVVQALQQWQEQRIDRLFHGAPAAIIVAADAQASCPGEDALLATQNILLAAQSLGLGTCLVGFVVEAARRDRRIAAVLKLSKDERIYSVIACGYPAVRFLRPAGRKPIAPRVLTLGPE